MNDEMIRKIAVSLDASEEVMPFIPELLADLWSLGSNVDNFVSLLQPLNLPPRETRVLDLGCGKGAISVEIAGKLGFTVLGIDLFAPFIDEAKKYAEKYRVAELCRFEVADMRDAVNEYDGFDVVILASVADALGPLDEAIEALRKTVNTGGFMIIDDGFLKGEHITESHYGYVPSHEEALKQLTSCGDELLREVITPQEKAIAIDLAYFDAIKKRAEGLVRRHPDKKEIISDFVNNQQKENWILETEVVWATWLLRKA